MMKSAMASAMTAILPQLLPLNNAHAIENSIAARIPTPTAISSLKKLGIETVMLTGDNEKTARAVAQNVGIDKVIANVLPAEKANVIKKLQSEGKVVAMVGDGINDAPALAQADIGIAIGSGSDIAKETGGIILIKDDIMDVARAVKLSRATMRKIKQNLFWALAYNTGAIPVAAIGLLSPIVAAAAMALSSISVIANSALLKRFKISTGEESRKVIATKESATNVIEMTKSVS